MEVRSMTDWSSRSIRVRALVERLRDRLTADDYNWAAENADNVEWEIAVEVIRSAERSGQLIMTEDEAGELADIES
jgi:hypothetical protein